MRVVCLTKTGDYDVLQVQERPAPQLGPGQVRIKVHAAGVNFADNMARQGLYPDAPKLPAVVGYEVAGEVLEGEGIAAGTRVMAPTHFGGYAEEVCVPATDVVALPDAISYEEGAAIPVNYATAWAGLIRYGSLQPGEKVLIHAAAGGVGIAATQIAKDAGAEVYGTASPSKHDRIVALGVDHPLDYTRKGWQKSLPKMDVVMDAIGGRSFATSYGLLDAGGRLVAFGASSLTSGEKRDVVAMVRGAVSMPWFSLIKQMSASKAVIGLNILTLWDAAGTLEPWLEPLKQLMERGVVQPVVAEAVPFDRAGDAHRLLAERRNVGKVVLVP